METGSRHQCLIYDGAPSKKLPLVATILKARMEEGYRCLYLNTATMVAGMRSALAALGVDVVNETARTRLVLSAEPVTAGVFNTEAMLRMLEASLDQALHDGYKGLWATGDMSWEFGENQDFSKLLEYELGLEQLFQRRKELCGICQYHRDVLTPEAMRQGLHTHSRLVINETLSRINPHYLTSAETAEHKNATEAKDELIAAICDLGNMYS